MADAGFVDIAQRHRHGLQDQEMNNILKI